MNVKLLVCLDSSMEGVVLCFALAKRHEMTLVALGAHILNLTVFEMNIFDGIFPTSFIVTNFGH